MFPVDASVCLIGAVYSREPGDPAPETGRELKWALGDPREHPIDITEEPRGKPGALRLAPARGILEADAATARATEWKSAPLARGWT
jgi:hypothetical protein